jgi:hypothetical protein
MNSSSKSDAFRYRLRTRGSTCDACTCGAGGACCAACQWPPVSTMYNVLPLDIPVLVVPMVAFVVPVL